MEWDVVVVGAGAAGLVAAIAAAERGRRTLILEKNTRPGVKILMSGGTRCNLTQATDARGIVQAFGEQGPFLHSALAGFPPDRVRQLVEQEGVSTKIEPGGKVFPASDRAVDVLEAILRRLARSGAELACGEPLARLETTGGRFQLTTCRRSLAARAVIVTTGGMSYPGCGTTGDGYAWAAQMGHAIVPPKPALTPVVTNARWTSPLRGVTVPDVVVQVVGSDRQPRTAGRASPGGRPPGGRQCRASARGSLLFTHFGLSGPVVLDVSREISASDRPETLQLCCDLLPDDSGEQLARWLDERCEREGGKQFGSILAERLPRRLGQSLSELSGVGPDRRAAEVPRRERRRLVEAIKRLPVSIQGVMGFRKAEVTAGGVRLDEVESRSMQSKRVAGLYFAGEVLDVDGPIGGYNFQAAFSTGWRAGQSV